MVYYYDVKLTHAFIFIIPCVLISLFKVKDKRDFHFIIMFNVTMFRSGQN